jgi:hypothetical protein
MEIKRHQPNIPRGASLTRSDLGARFATPFRPLADKAPRSYRPAPAVTENGSVGGFVGAGSSIRTSEMTR